MEKNKNETGIPIWLDSTVYKMKDERKDSRRTLNTAADARIMEQELPTGHANHPNCSVWWTDSQPTRYVCPTVDYRVERSGGASARRIRFRQAFRLREQQSRQVTHT
jgi:hypothetical protein